MVVPAGTYVVNTQIVMSDNEHGIILEGAATLNGGMEAGTDLIYQGSASPFISAQNGTGVDIRNLMIEIERASLAIDFEGSVYAILEESSVGSMSETPAVQNATLVSLNNTVNSVIRHVRFTSGNVAIFGTTDSQHYANTVLIEASYFQNFVSPPIQGVNQMWTIIGNVFEPLQDGSAGAIAGGGPAGLDYSGNWHGDVINGKGTWVAVQGRGITINGNFIQGGAVGVDLLAAFGAQISGNTFAAMGTGIVLGTPTYGSVVSGNDFSGVTGTAISSPNFAQGTGTSIFANYSPSSPKPFTVNGNFFVASGGNGIVLKSPNGSACALFALDNSVTLRQMQIPCPWGGLMAPVIYALLRKQKQKNRTETPEAAKRLC